MGRLFGIGAHGKNKLSLSIGIGHTSLKMVRSGYKKRSAKPFNDQLVNGLGLA